MTNHTGVFHRRRKSPTVRRGSALTRTGDRVVDRSIRRRLTRKRAFDVVVSSLLLLAVLPLFALVAIAIKLDSRGPVFYRVRRIGHRGRLFRMTKFRKMRVDATGGPLTTAKDPRFTRVGALLTKTRLDELPQLWDVLRGRMSIVGPRPEDPRFVALHADTYETILSVRPGITGITQLAFADEANILDSEDPISHYVAQILPQKMSLDTLYVSNIRMRLDLAVLVWTVVAMIMGRPVAVHRNTARMRIRQRPRSAVPASAGMPHQRALTSNAS
jgi:lipopolysaccharide/colanic/teichoic acid biosynthesis glycosyltransferase